jgi:hypothetical protein
LATGHDGPCEQRRTQIKVSWHAVSRHQRFLCFLHHFGNRFYRRTGKMVLIMIFQIAALVIYATELYNYVWFGVDVVGHGIWAGSFYVIAGSLGIAAAYKRTTSL